MIPIPISRGKVISHERIIRSQNEKIINEWQVLFNWVDSGNQVIELHLSSIE
jgi:hypothetical protein